MERPLVYNEDKVERDVASILGAFNMDGDALDDINKTFERYERLNIRTKNLSFHMNINPLEGQDNMSEKDIVEFARKMMEGLGYGKQPFVIYRHNDIERAHYHVVSVRTDENGKKISDYMENKRCNDLLWQLSKEFDYKVGNAYKKRRSRSVEKFDPSIGDVTTQLREIYKECLNYHFTSYEQFWIILRSHGVMLDARSESSTKFYLRGMDDSGRSCTKALSAKKLGMDLYNLYKQRSEDSLTAMKVMSMERNRLRRCSRGPLADSVSQAHFVNMLAKNGISVRLERDPKTHNIVDANFIDHVTKTAFNISELGPDLSLDMLRDADEHQWEHDNSMYADSGVTLGDFIAGLAAKGSKSKERDLTDDPRKRKGRKLKF